MSEDEESLHQEGRLQSVVEMMESLRLDVSSNKRNIDNLFKLAFADRTERDGMVTTIAQHGVTIAQHGVTITELGGTIAQHGVTIENLVTERKKESDLIVLFDLICLYRFYFVLPKILASKNHANWDGLCEAITNATDAHEDGDMTDDDYNTLRAKWNTYSPAVDIFTLRKWSTVRHYVAHSDTRSTRDQQKFIAASNLQIFADSHMNDLRVLLVASLNTLSAGELKRNK